MLVLVQVISAKTVNADEASPTTQNQTVNLSGGMSVHRLHALVVSGDNINLYPCVFKSGNQSKGKK